MIANRCESRAHKTRAQLKTGRNHPNVATSHPAAVPRRSRSIRVTRRRSGAEPGGARSAPDLNVSTGAATTTYAFELPAARGSGQPSLALVHYSQTSLGQAGVGWSLNLPLIVRKRSSRLPRFQDPVLGSSELITGNSNGEHSITFRSSEPIDGT